MKRIPNELFFEWVEQELAEGHHVRFRLKGDSMFPLLRSEKDEVVLYPCEDTELRPMDVVLFRYRGKHVLHRILRKDGEHLLIQGDGSYVAKEHCTISDVVGKVHEVIRPSGKVWSVEGWQWKLASRLWRSTGVFRRPLLRLFHHKW